MNRFAQAWARITGSTTLTPPASGANADGGTDQTVTLTKAQSDQLQADYEADVADARTAGAAEGSKAAHDRFNAVLDSDAGKANPLGARTLLSNDKLTADEIVAMLPNLGVTGGEAPEAKEEERNRQTHLDRTTRLNLAPEGGTETETASGGGEPGASAGKSTWAKVQKDSSNTITEGGMRGAVPVR